jgi:Periplasmic copper-binding protein (NosD)
MSRNVLTFVRAIAFVAVVSTPFLARAATTLVVGQGASCPNAQFSKIQDAVNAASPGDTIQICPGQYDEQVTIDKKLEVDGNNGAVIRPANVSANTTGIASGKSIAAIVLVDGATDVTIRNVIVDGADSAIVACSPDLIGVFYRNASGELSRVAVRNVKLAANLNGCQSGSAILVQSGGGGKSVVGIAGSSIHDYQKNGITANEIGTQVVIEENFVTGLGPTNGAAQNGIQIGYGAEGTIRHNTVANHIWLPCVSLDSCDATGEDVLVFHSDGVTVHHNVLGVSQTGLAIVGNDGKAFDNDIFDSQIFDGLQLIGNDNTAERNRIAHSDEAGVLVDGNSNVVRQNVVNESAFGVLKLSGSTGNVIANNTFFNSIVKVQDPPPTKSKASPYR